mgnify:CR=1 FL=1
MDFEDFLNHIHVEYVYNQMHPKKQMYIQTKSYDELLNLASNKDKLFAAMPAIQPVSNKELKRLSSGYGVRIHPILKTRKMHHGIDFSAPTGTPIYATGDGVVKRVHSSPGGYGKQIELDHGYGYTTKYAHMSMFNVKKGQKVKRGECIGYVGNSGRSTAPHLHYEVLFNGRQVNPLGVKLPAGEKLKKADLKNFESEKAKIDGLIEDLKQPAAIAKLNTN